MHRLRVPKLSRRVTFFGLVMACAVVQVLYLAIDYGTVLRRMATIGLGDHGRARPAKPTLSNHALDREANPEGIYVQRAAIWRDSSVEDARQQVAVLSVEQAVERLISRRSRSVPPASDAASRRQTVDWVSPVVPSAFVLADRRAAANGFAAAAWHGVPATQGILANDSIIGWLECPLRLLTRSRYDARDRCLPGRRRCGEKVVQQVRAMLAQQPQPNEAAGLIDTSSGDRCAFHLAGTEGYFCIVRVLDLTSKSNPMDVQAGLPATRSLGPDEQDVDSGVLVAGSHLNWGHYREFVQCNANWLVVRSSSHARAALSVCPLSRIVCALSAASLDEIESAGLELLCDDIIDLSDSAVVPSAHNNDADDTALKALVEAYVRDQTAKNVRQGKLRPSLTTPASSDKPSLAARSAFGLYISQVSGAPLRSNASNVASWNIDCVDARHTGRLALAHGAGVRNRSLDRALADCVAVLVSAINSDDVDEAERDSLLRAAQFSGGARAEAPLQHKQRKPRAWQTKCEDIISHATTTRGGASTLRRRSRSTMSASKLRPPGDTSASSTSTLDVRSSTKLWLGFVWEMVRVLLPSRVTSRYQAMQELESRLKGNLTSRHQGAYYRPFVPARLESVLNAAFANSLERLVAPHFYVHSSRALNIRCCEHVFRARPLGVNVVGATGFHYGLATTAREMLRFVRDTWHAQARNRMGDDRAPSEYGFHVTNLRWAPHFTIDNEDGTGSGELIFSHTVFVVPGTLGLCTVYRSVFGSLEHLLTTHLIVVPYWELTQLPRASLEMADCTDTTWAASDFIAQMFLDRSWTADFNLNSVPTVDATSSHQRVTVPHVQPMRHYLSREMLFPTSALERLAQQRARADRAWDAVDSCANTTFVFVFDHTSSLDRKNPTGAIDAFELAFPLEYDTDEDRAMNVARARRRSGGDGSGGEEDGDEDDVVRAVDSLGMRLPVSLARLARAGRPRALRSPPGCANRYRFAHLLLKTMPYLIDARKRAEFDRLKAKRGVQLRLVTFSSIEQRVFQAYAGSVCISLHRSEGLGLNLLESMVFGVPCIVTNATGSSEFSTESTAFLVPAVMGPIGKDRQYPHVRNCTLARWAEPNVKAAAAWMRVIHSNPELVFEKGRAAASLVQSQWLIEPHNLVLAETLSSIEMVRRSLWLRNFSLIDAGR